MKDLKYLAAMTLPLSAVISIYFKGSWSYFTPFYAFVMIPILEILLPHDTSNHEGDTRNEKSKSKVFDWMLYLNLPVVFGLLAYLLWDVSEHAYALYEIIGLIFSMGIVLGTNGINVAHELGHRQKSFERHLGKLLLLTICTFILNTTLGIMPMRQPKKTQQLLNTIRRYILFGLLLFFDNILVLGYYK